MLNRRDFSALGGTGLSGIALVAMPASNGCLRGHESPIRPPMGRRRHPNARRAPHFTPKAKNVLVISVRELQPFETWDTSGTVSNATPTRCPARKKLITFQGENGNLTKPLWNSNARPERQNDFGAACPIWRNCGTTSALSIQ